MTTIAGKHADVTDYFELLDRWRHFPSYRLEPHVDGFFALFLSDVLSAHTGMDIDWAIVPEFPLRKGTLHGDNVPDANMSSKVDFLAVTPDLSRALLVELKTDMASRNERQDENMKIACERGLGALLDGVVRSAIAAKSRRNKHGHLIFELAEIGLLSLPDELAGKLWGASPRGVKSLLGEIRPTVASARTTISVLHIQPLKPAGQPDVIDFAEFADAIAKRGPMAQMFGQMLRNWTATAGRRAPKSADENSADERHSLS